MLYHIYYQLKSLPSDIINITVGGSNNNNNNNNLNSSNNNSKDITIFEYQHIINNSFMNYEILITVHEMLRKIYSNIQLQIQFILWKFWDKTREPISFSIDDEIISQILSSNSYNLYKQQLNKNNALQNLQDLTKMTP
eukprot:UN03540